MAIDPVDDAVRRAGDDPSAAFAAGLESTLASAYDGDMVVTPTSTADATAADGGPGLRLIAIAAAVVVVAASIVGGAVLLRHDSDEPSLVDQPTPATAAPVTRSAPATTVPATSAAATTPPTVTTSPTIVPEITPVPVTIDLTSASPELQPTIVASLPITPPGDLFPTAYATPAGDDRIAVLDEVTGVITFIDASTGAELSSYPTSIPTIGSTAVVAGVVLVGPEDVVYVNVGNADSNSPTIIAYALRGDTYVEVARQQHGIGDSGIISLGPVGVALPGSGDAPIMRYVDTSGQPSGVSLDMSEVFYGPNDLIGRGGRAWNFAYTMPVGVAVPDDCCSFDVQYGPNDSVVLQHYAPQPDGDIRQKVTVLDETVTSYDTDWAYVGALGDQLLFTHLDQDSIDIGTLAI